VSDVQANGVLGPYGGVSTAARLMRVWSRTDNPETTARTSDAAVFTRLEPEGREAPQQTRQQQQEKERVINAGRDTLAAPSALLPGLRRFGCGRRGELQNDQVAASLDHAPDHPLTWRLWIALRRVGRAPQDNGPDTAAVRCHLLCVWSCRTP